MAVPQTNRSALWSSYTEVLRTGEGATPRASRLSAEGRAGLFPNDNVNQSSDQAQRAGAGQAHLSQPTNLGHLQDAPVDTQGGLTP